MKKIYFLFFVADALIIALIAVILSGKFHKQKDSAAEGKTETAVAAAETVETKEETVESAAVYEESGNPQEEKQTEEDSASEYLYEDFLNNKTTVHIKTEEGFGNFSSLSEVEDQNLTLDELVNTIIEEHKYGGDDTDVKLDRIEYAYMDCGNDGNRELALTVYMLMYMEPPEQHLIIKDMDGTLQIIYSDEAWSRYSIHMNEYGYIFGDGTTGAAYNHFDKSYIDADGKWHFLYSDYSTVDISPEGYVRDLEFNGGDHELPEDMQLDGEYCFLDFDFNNDPFDDSKHCYTYAKIPDIDSEADWQNGNRSYFYTDLVYDDSIYQDTHPLKQFFENEGLHIYTLKEIEEMIAEKEAAEGMTEVIKNGKNIEWEILEDFTEDASVTDDEKVNEIINRMNLKPWKDAYVEKIREFENEVKDWGGYATDSVYYDLIYLDDNDTPELVTACVEGGTIYTYDNGKAVDLSVDTGSWHSDLMYFPRSGMLLEYSWDGAGAIQYYQFWKFNNASVKSASPLLRYENNGNDVYTADEKEVTQHEFYGFFEKIGEYSVDPEFPGIVHMNDFIRLS
ncbi:MAG: hypothetical protein K5894_01850 [Lachnospiraceae bacterium]|nr:hypothetical protein [Lachnospiraceae bacterium]